jgi:hypothetical protein
VSDTAPEPKFVIRGEPNPLNVITISAEGELHVRGELVTPDVYSLLTKLVRLVAAAPEARNTDRDLDPKAVNESLDALLSSSDLVRADLAKVRTQLVLASVALDAADELLAATPAWCPRHVAGTAAGEDMRASCYCTLLEKQGAYLTARAAHRSAT